MRRLWFLLMAATVLITALAWLPPRAVAAGSDAYPKTDFTRVTPASAIVYAVLQSSSARQARTVNQIAGSIGSQPVIQTVLGTILGAGSVSPGSGGVPGSGNGGAVGNAQQLLPLLTGTLSRVFNGEVGLAILPPTITSSKGAITPHVHLLLDAGLQAGVTAGALLFAVAAFGLPTTSVPGYHGFTITGLDLNKLARTIGKLMHNTQLANGTLIPANGPLSSTFYGAVAGNVAVLASDLPTLRTALDTYDGADPSIAAGDAYAETVGLLPSERFVTIYLHLDAAVLVQVVRSLLGMSAASLPAPQVSAGPGRAFSITAEPQALLLTMSAPPGTSSMVIALPALP